MSTSFQQSQSEGPCLRYPDNLGLHRELSYEAALNMLLRAIPMSQTVPFSWCFIDKPPEGQVMLLYLQPHAPFPNDGIRFQDQEVKFTIPVGSTRELEVHEVKFGFIPGSQDANAWRCRRRYRLHKGGHPQLVLVHFTRGPGTPIAPSLINQPVRAYPLRVITEPAVYISGDKAGQKVFPPGAPMHAPPPSAPPMQNPGMGMNFNQQQAMVARRNEDMEMLERRRERERGRDRSGSTATRPHRVEDDDSGDDNDQISSRTLAVARYKRNYDLMNEVFKVAAYGGKDASTLPTPYSIFNKVDLEAKTAQLEKELGALAAKSAARKKSMPAAPTHEITPAAATDVSMTILQDAI